MSEMVPDLDGCTDEDHDLDYSTTEENYNYDLSLKKTPEKETYNQFVKPSLTPGKTFMIDGEQTIVPFIGMQFNSIEVVEDNYNRYAKRFGFSVRVKKIRKSKIDGELLQKNLCCSREGLRKNNPQVKKHHAITRCECKAKIQITRIEVGLWQVLAFEQSHTHQLTSPQKSCHLRSHKQIPESAKRLILSLSNTNLRPSQIYRFIRAQYSAKRALNFTAKDCSNLIANDRRKSITGADAQHAINRLAEMKRQDNNFFYTFDIDESGKLISLLWAHGRSRMYYKYFGDVITFDSTYRTNVYGMPFAPFVGVNNHKQIILLGGALLSNETTQSYTWVLQQWLEWKQPHAIITDQDLAIKAAISQVFPTSTHRYCIWHIMRKFRDKFKRRKYDLFRDCVYKSKEREEFDNNWKVIIETEELGSNDWLQFVFREREHWVSAYMNDVFFAAMKSTQRSESMNSFFKAYLDQRKSLKEFVEGYNQAFETRISSEIEECTKNINSISPLKTSWPLEMHASKIYTNGVFKKFQEQVLKRTSFYLKVILHDDFSKVYQVIGYYEHQRTTTVFFYYLKDELSCSCKKFFFKGWPCSHMLKVMEELGYRHLPDVYFLKRWTREDLFYINKGKDTEGMDVIQSSRTMRELDLRKLVDQYIDLASKHETTYELSRQWLQDHILLLLQNTEQLNEDIQSHMEQEDIHNLQYCDEATVDEMSILNPQLRRGKGRPSIQNRIKAPTEQVKRQTRVCKQCNEKGHNIRTCKKRKQQIERGSNSDDIQSCSQ